MDAVSAMVTREDLDPRPLLQTRVEIGLHLELEQMPLSSRATGAERGAAIAALRVQLGTFEAAFGRRAAYLDGHHHCHARDGLGAAIGRIASEHNLPVRSVDPRHRRLLRCMGIPTPDRLLGRLQPSDAALPEELAAVLDGSAKPPPGVTEWMVHPGHRDDEATSSYDAAREHDLDLVFDLANALGHSFRRATHAALAR